MRLDLAFAGRTSLGCVAALLGISALILAGCSMISNNAAVPDSATSFDSQPDGGKPSSSEPLVICEFTPSALRTRSLQLSSEDAEVRRRLNQPVTLHLQDRPLLDAISEIAKFTEVEVVLDEEALAKESISRDVPVSLEAEGIAAKNALVVILEPLGLRNRIEKGIVRVTASSDLEGVFSPVVYVIPELLTRHSHVTVNLDEFSPQPSFEPTFISEEDRQQTMEMLVDLIVSVTEPSSWEQTGGNGAAKANLETNSILVLQSPRVHEEIHDLLESLVRSGTLQATWHVEGFAADPNQLSILQPLKPEEGSEVHFYSGPPSGPERSVSADSRLLQLDPKAADQWRHKLGTAKCDVTLTLTNGQFARLSYQSPIDRQKTITKHVDLQSSIAVDRRYVRLLVASDDGDFSVINRDRLNQTANDGQSLLLVPSLPATAMNENGRANSASENQVMAFLLTPKVVSVEEVEATIGSHD